jgi:paraquat-inducible protein A
MSGLPLNTSPFPPLFLVGCPDCGLLQRPPRVQRGMRIDCARCGHVLARAGSGLDLPLAFAATAFVLFLAAAFAPLMVLRSFGIVRPDALASGPLALWGAGHAPLAVLVTLFSVLIPFVFLALMMIVLGALRLAMGKGPAAGGGSGSGSGVGSGLARLFRWAVALRQWAMVEVYLVGCCVAYSRLQAIGGIEVGTGGWCLLGAALALLLMLITLDERAVWNALPIDVSEGSAAAPPGTASAAPRVSCETCGLVVGAQYLRGACPRCGARIERRKPGALRRTAALVITGFLLYVPANLLPFLSIERFGHDQPNTILRGVRELISAGLWPLAIVVFMASVFVPLVKLFGLTLMLVLTRRRSRLWLIGRTRLYRVIELIGRWSSIDLFMVSILVALVRFGTLTSVRADSGATAFAAVVVVTMFASRSFDPRLMWDVAATERASHPAHAEPAT